ncbi:MAG: hypothetical protein AB8B69_02430 [Chitinophagales bacterium]
MTTNQTYFDEYGELNTLGRMLYAEAIRFNRLDDLPDNIYNHVLQSPWASAEILDLYTLIEDEDYDVSSLHPSFDMSDKSISGDMDDIERILNQLKAEAIPNPTYEKAIKEQVFRSSGAAAASLKVKAPISEQLITENFIDFEWETSSNKDLILTLENSKGRLVKERLSAKTKKFRIDLLPKSKFPSGMYYWKLALRGGQLIIGKVYIFSS